MFTTFQTASQGLAVQREKISVASRNIANAGTSAPEGSPNVYKPQSVQTTAPSRESFKQLLLESVGVLNKNNPQQFNSIQNKMTGLGPEFRVTEEDNFRFEYDPNHPDADENGMVRYPDIDLIREMTQMMSATKLYEANLSTIEAEKEIIKRSLEI
ncbi:MAG: flagellar basal body rod C-terminal domain-containing protein [Balneolaceae bacterium]